MAIICFSWATPSGAQSFPISAQGSHLVVCVETKCGTYWKETEDSHVQNKHIISLLPLSSPSMATSYCHPEITAS